MKLVHWGVAALAMFVVGCGPVEETVPTETTGTQEVEETVPAEVTGTQEAGLALACTNWLGCRESCDCQGGYCVPGGFSPPPPQAHCDTPPVRACSTGSDCTTGCNCVGNVCVNDGFSPPANCLLAPPDAFESDNTHTSASSYTGTPQLKHTFHRAGDVDWALVATPINQVMTVEAYNLRNSVQLRVDIYAYDYATRTLGALLGSTQTTICSQITPSCFVYRATANVVAGGVYAVKVTDRRTVPSGSDWRPTAGYDLKMY